MTWLLVFVAMFALDFVWALYTAGVAEKRIQLAGAGAAAITLLSGYVMTLYVMDNWLLIPAALGAYAGTVVAVSVETSALIAKCRRFAAVSSSWFRGLKITF